MAVISKDHGSHAAGPGLGTALMYLAMAAAAIAVSVPAAIIVMG
jgi:tRNA A37 threonylcarbamoyltransferase TsaD